MTRLRLAFLLLTAALLAPLAFLAMQAVEHADLQQLVRHDTLARRVFDEMERSLTDLLRREEERPFDQYRTWYVPEGGTGAGQTLTRSPLATIPPDPFIIAYFQIEPGGRLSMPLSPDSAPDDAGRSSRARALPELSQWVEGRLGAQGRPVEAPPSKLDDGYAESQLPGTTRTLQTAALPSVAKGEVERLEQNQQWSDPLSMLNLGTSTRGNRAQVKKLTPATKTRNFYGAPDDPNPAKPSLEQQVLAPEGAVEVELDPMVGRLVSEERLILYRTLVIGDDAWRQGLLIDVPALMDWLAAKALVAEAPATADTREAAVGRIGRFEGGRWSPGDDAALPPGDYVFRHRFAEPFGGLAGTLTLDPLPAYGANLSLYALSALLVFIGLGALFALYRMVTTQLAFAERRNNFVSAVTHELKTPLTAIRMYSEMLREGMVPNDEKRQQYYETITAEAERLSRLINNVLELARIGQAGPSTRAPREGLVSGDPAPVIREAITIVGPHARSQGFSLEVEVAPGVRPITYDRDALLQVLVNVVDNALKYARDSEDKRVIISLQPDGDRTVLAVRDRGPGVPPAQLRHVFEPFYRGERELTRRTQGTGIGLALVKGLAERMGAEVACRNAAGGGFEVRLIFNTPVAAPSPSV